MKVSPLILREARKRAGLSQAELARRAERPQQSIARWEGGRVEPSFETLQELVRACGWELVTDLARADPEYEGEIRRQLQLSPAARLRSTLRTELDCTPVIGALESAGVRYVVIGALAAALRGSPRLIDVPVVEVTPAKGQARTLDAALAALKAVVLTEDALERADEDVAVARSRYALPDDAAELWLTERPWGTRGFADLRRDADRIALSKGSTVLVTATQDLARIAAAAPAAAEGAQAATLRAVARLSE